MGRTRRKSGKRMIVNCFLKCLNEHTYPDLLKWTGKGSEFSIFFRRKDSPNWDPKDLDFFKELDRQSPTKHEKYKHQLDRGQACKRRCKANLRKLCEDNVFEFVRKKDIDKCTKILYYNFIEIPSDEDNKLLPLVEKRVSTDSFSSSDESVHSSATFSSNEFVQTPISLAGSSRKRKYDELVPVVGIEGVDYEVSVAGVEEVIKENLNFNLRMEDNSISSHRGVEENLLPEAEDSINLNFWMNCLKEDSNLGLVGSSGDGNPSEKESGINSNYNFIPRMEDDSTSSHRCLEENPIPEAEDSFSLYGYLEKDSVNIESVFQALWSEPCAPKISKTMDIGDVAETL